MDTATLVLSIIALLIAAASFYASYLRGPDIYLAIPGEDYPVHGAISTVTSDYSGHAGPTPPIWKIVSRLIIVNAGVSAGVLYAFRIDPADDIIQGYKLEPAPDESLPKSLAPGEGWNTVLTVTLKTGPWREHRDEHPMLLLKAIVVADPAFRQPKTRNVDLRIKIKDAYPSLS